MHRDRRATLPQLKSGPPLAVVLWRALAASDDLRGLPARVCAALLASARHRTIPAIADHEYRP